MKQYDLVLIIAHIGYRTHKITEEICIKALPEDISSNIRFVLLDIAKTTPDESYNLPFEDIALEEKRFFKANIEPILENNHNILLTYFGIGPIPLIFHLGYLFKSFNYTDLWIYQWHHEKNEWLMNYAVNDNFFLKEIREQLPIQKQKGNGDIIITISTSYEIDLRDCMEVVPNSTNEFHILLNKTHRDSLYNQEILSNVVDQFLEILQSITDKLPDKEKIHLFIASSAGLPFILGTKINPTVYPSIQTYQFHKNSSPKNKIAVLINSPSNDRRSFSIDEETLAQHYRAEWAKQLNNEIRGLINTESENWLQNIADGKSTSKISDFWKNLPSLRKVSLQYDSINLEEVNVSDGFDYAWDKNEWKLDNGFFIGLYNRLNKFKNNIDLEKTITQAGRLFLFHEALHYSDYGHQLNKEIATGISNFPKVIEDADYQADVWAILHEYKFSRIHNPSAISHLKIFFLGLIDVAVETMWSFVDTGTVLEYIQVRSIQRFLNWYWQYIRIESLEGQGSLEEILKILFEKPTIEFAETERVTLSLQRQRLSFKLTPNQALRYEIAIFHRNKIYRFSPTNINDIVDGFRKLDGELIKRGLRSFKIKF